jgi:hypothetical protein
MIAEIPRGRFRTAASGLVFATSKFLTRRACRRGAFSSEAGTGSREENALI